MGKNGKGKYRKEYCNLFQTEEDVKNAAYVWTVSPNHRTVEISTVDELKKLGEKYYFTV